MNFEIELSQEDVEQFEEEFISVVNSTCQKTLETLGEVAVEHLRDLDNSLGHHELAGMWDKTAVTETPDDFSLEAFSHAEDKTFYTGGWDSSGNRVEHDQRFPIAGEMLLAILETGAGAHFIFPVNARHLVIPGASFSEKAAQFHKEYGFTYRHTELADKYQYADDVLHPGVLANSNVLNTGRLLEAGLDQYAAEAAEAIAVELR